MERRLASRCWPLGQAGHEGRSSRSRSISRPSWNLPSPPRSYFAHRADGSEAHLLLAADGLPVGRRRIDGDPAMTALIEQEPDEQADCLRAHARSSPRSSITIRPEGPPDGLVSSYAITAKARLRVPRCSWLLLAREGTCGRSLAGRAAGDDPGTRALLGFGLRLAAVRGQAQRPAPVHDRNRRARHSLHPRAVTA
jgi:hypothetical protein